MGRRGAVILPAPARSPYARRHGPQTSARGVIATVNGVKLRAVVSGLVASAACVGWIGVARAAIPVTDPVQEPEQGAAAPAPSAEPSDQDVRTSIPNLVYAYTAYRATAETVGAQAYGLGVGASGQRGILGGGISVWGSPIERITLIGDGQRNSFGNFAPSVAVRVGVDSQARVRVAGPKVLPNGRIWDVAAGPQLLVGSQRFFGALTGGPTTIGLLSEHVGWQTVLTVGGATL
jgi:hypothetical protein